MEVTTVVTEQARRFLGESGSLDFLDLADMITDETEIPVRDVERTLRVLLLDGVLAKNGDYDIIWKNGASMKPY